MKYSPEIIGEIARRLAGRYVPTDVRNILAALEDTDEQKQLREAERLLLHVALTYRSHDSAPDGGHDGEDDG